MLDRQLACGSYRDSDSYGPKRSVSMPNSPGRKYSKAERDLVTARMHQVETDSPLNVRSPRAGNRLRNNLGEQDSSIAC